MGRAFSKQLRKWALQQRADLYKPGIEMAYEKFEAWWDKQWHQMEDARTALAAPKVVPAEPVAWRIRYRSPAGMIGHYPWAYQDTKPLKSPRPEHEIEALYATTEQAQLGSSCFDGSAAYEAYLDALPSLKTMPDPQWDGDVDEATYKAGWNDCALKAAAALAAILDAPLQSSDDKTHE